MMQIITQTCTKCGRILLDSSVFYYWQKKRQRFRADCKVCVAKRDRQYYLNNREKIRQRNKQYDFKNRDKKLQYSKQYYLANKDLICKKNRQYYHKHRTRYQHTSKQYRLNNKDTLANKKQRYILKNAKQVALRSKHYRNSYVSYSKLKSLKLYHTIQRDDNNLGQIRCIYCNRWHNPTYQSVQSRLRIINTKTPGSMNFYCSEECKQACPTYKKQLYPKGFKKETSREVDPYTRKLCFEKDDHTCQRCDAKYNVQLHCHHISGAVQDPLVANDIDNVITLCKECHKDVHAEDGCSYVDYRRKECA